MDILSHWRCALTGIALMLAIASGSAYAASPDSGVNEARRLVSIYCELDARGMLLSDESFDTGVFLSMLIRDEMILDADHPNIIESYKILDATRNEDRVDVRVQYVSIGVAHGDGTLEISPETYVTTFRLRVDQGMWKIYEPAFPGANVYRSALEAHMKGIGRKVMEVRPGERPR